MKVLIKYFAKISLSIDYKEISVQCQSNQSCDVQMVRASTQVTKLEWQVTKLKNSIYNM